MLTYEEKKNEGNTYFLKNEYQNAITSYNDCILLNPEEPVAYSNKAMSLIKLGEYEQAIRVCNVALTKIDPNNEKYGGIQKKIEYRINLARNLITKRNNQTTHNNGASRDIVIQEVDNLPQEFAVL
ncbi:hypothetical protein C6P45_005304 [Maudiozyma exigua]|uniref:Uncharacterized protein n=1 Tax=Maudiozyma exigua TaxID=34358 RepID=A0A9P6WE04_MAUEX|nr:hypothetical protein C6P45_005304 [Kazachstania exigua]